MVDVLDPVLFQRSAEGTRALLVADIEDVFRSLDLSKPEAARDELLRFMPVLVAEHGSMASQVALDYYDEARFVAGVGGSFRATESASAYQTAVEPMVRRSAGALWTEAPVETLSALTAALPKYALSAPRQTIMDSVVQDPEATGWHRETRGATCEFCKALAARGNIYRKGAVTFAAHAHCDCVSVPSWDANATEVPVEAYKLSTRTTQWQERIERGKAQGAGDRWKRDGARAQRALDNHRKMTAEWIKTLT